jgi:type I restriction enzyme S subunit
MKMWPQVQLGELLVRRKDEIEVSDEVEYARLTIRLNGNGIDVRDRVLGRDIGTKKQFVARSGQLVLSKIDARNGAFGVLPNHCDQAIITGNFWAFDVDKNRLDPTFFECFTRTRNFLAFCIRASEGTTNRRYLQEPLFLQQPIPLPTLEEQLQIVERIENLVKRVREASRLQAEINSDAEDLLMSIYRQIVEGAQRKPLGEVAPLNRRPVNVETDKIYPQVSVRSFGRGSFHREPLVGAEVTWEKPFRVESGDILISNIKAWEGAIAVATEADHGFFSSHRYLTCVPIPKVATSRFVCFHLLTPEGLRAVGEASPGSADRNRTLGVKALLRIPVPLPSYEQQLQFDEYSKRLKKLKNLHAESGEGLKSVTPALTASIFGLT